MRCCVISLCLREVNFFPSRMISPLVVPMSCMMVRERVDFPQPDSPTKPRISPLFRLREMPSTALIRSTCL